MIHGNKIPDKELLKEISTILRERTAYMNNLEKEKSQAQKYRDLQIIVTRAKASILNKRIEEKRREIKIRRHEDGTVVFWRYATVSSGSWQSREGKEFLVFRGTNAGYDKLRWADLRDPMEKAGKDRPYDPATPGGLTGTPNLRHIFR